MTCFSSLRWLRKRHRYMSCGYSTNSTPANFWWQTSSFNELVLIATVIKLVKQALLYRSYTRARSSGSPRGLWAGRVFLIFPVQCRRNTWKTRSGTLYCNIPRLLLVLSARPAGHRTLWEENPANGRMALMSGLRESVSSVLLTSEGGVLHKPPGVYILAFVLITSGGQSVVCLARRKIMNRPRDCGRLESYPKLFDLWSVGCVTMYDGGKLRAVFTPSLQVPFWLHYCGITSREPCGGPHFILLIEAS